MPSIVRPRREFSFADFSKNQPREPIPGDRLDAQITNLIDAIISTQKALADLRRDDGGLKNQVVGMEQLKSTVHAAFVDDVADATAFNARRAEQGAAVVKATERTTALFAQDAERAAVSAAQFLNAVNAAQQLVDQHNHHITALADSVDGDATDAENWATYSKAQADNAIKAKEEALAWAEYLAGPVVNSADAPAYIAESAWPNGLYYQPVEGYGGTGGLWSAKWWAIYAQNLVGPWSALYLGAWPQAPLPGSQNPWTGQPVPNPLPPGSFYYDETTGQLMIWNGSAWQSPFVLATGAEARLVYLATEGQTVFAGPDFHGNSPTVGDAPSDVHVDGLLLLEGLDYAIDTVANTLTLVEPAAEGDVVQWDLLVSPNDLAPGTMFNFKLEPMTGDGTTTVFTMTYRDFEGVIQSVDVADGMQLQISLDGVIQEPGLDYTASTDQLTMVVAPRADSKLWGIWFKSAGVSDITAVSKTYVDDQDALRVLKAGDVMTGFLMLHADPTDDLHAATKQYVDDKPAADVDKAYVDAADALKADTTYVDSQDALKVSKAGDTMTGALELPADPTTALQAATKQYVDNKPGGVTVSDTAPVGAAAGTLFWESDTGILYVNYNDGDSTQFVPAVPRGETGLTGPQGPPGPWTQITQAAYNALSPPNPATLYVIVG